MTEETKRGPGRPPKEQLEEAPVKSSVLSIDDISDQFDPGATVRLEQESRNPFADYPVKLIEARYYPRNQLLDQMSKDDLLKYCISNEFLAKEWLIKRGIPKDSKDQHEKILGIETSWQADKVRGFIDSKETHTFPSHHLVFCNLPPTKPGVPRMLPFKSWITRRFRMIWFDLQWPMPTREDPYRVGKHNQCAIVDDDSIRAQMFFERQVKTGAVIPKMNGKLPMFSLLRDDATKSLPILRRIFANGTKGSADLRLWEREEGKLPEAA